ncbi:hypothetical protein [Alishewanella longhuensis]
MIKEISHCSAAQPQPVLTDCSTLVFTGTYLPLEGQVLGYAAHYLHGVP